MTLICQTLRYSNECSGHSSHLLTGSNIVVPVMSIDGTHLYGKYKGTLLISMGCDGNNQLFPLAFSIKKGKNTNSWGWFLACIKNRVTKQPGICVISDRHPSIMAAMIYPHLGWATPSAYHSICMHHLTSNFMTRFKDKLLKNLEQL